LSDEREETFDLVGPRGIGGCEVNVPTRTSRKLSSDLGVLVGGAVVDDEMDVELGRPVGLDVAQEGEELLVPMARFALGGDRAVNVVPHYLHYNFGCIRSDAPMTVGRGRRA
jgi:hypothetical protein